MPIPGDDLRLTKSQKKDLETIFYFMPKTCKGESISDEDIKQFFAYSERGIKRGDEDSIQVRDGYHALLEGKRWRGIHMEMWENGVLDGSVPYFCLLGEMHIKKGWRKFFSWLFGKRLFTMDLLPQSVVDFMAGEMFKGVDAVLIKNLYDEMKAEYRATADKGFTEKT